MINYNNLETCSHCGIAFNSSNGILLEVHSKEEAENKLVVPEIQSYVFCSLDCVMLWAASMRIETEKEVNENGRTNKFGYRNRDN